MFTCWCSAIYVLFNLLTLTHLYAGTKVLTSSFVHSLAHWLAICWCVHVLISSAAHSLAQWFAFFWHAYALTSWVSHSLLHLLTQYCYILQLMMITNVMPNWCPESCDKLLSSNKIAIPTCAANKYYGMLSRKLINILTARLDFHLYIYFESSFINSVCCTLNRWCFFGRHCVPFKETTNHAKHNNKHLICGYHGP